MIELDGSYGEGGGAILRQALALSMHTGKAFKVRNIRAGRPRPGLRMQHLQALNTAQRLCSAQVRGNFQRSTEVTFKPGALKPQNLKVDIGTAGSVTLLLQSALLPCVFSEGVFRFEVSGGTDVKWSQPYEYFANVLVPRLRRFAEIEVELVKRGYYPKGGGLVKLKVKSLGEFPRLDLVERGELVQLKGVSHASFDLQKAEVAERQAENASLILGSKVPVDVSVQYARTASPGSGITLWAKYESPVVLGGDALGEPRKRAELVGEEAANSLKREMDSGAAVDKYLADQLIPFLAVVRGALKSSEITNHARSNIYVAEKFFDVKFETSGVVVKC